MARLRHFAVCVKDLEKAAQFYANVFDLKRVGREDLEIGSAIYMTDGVINLALLNFTGKAGSKASDLEEGTAFLGAHHFGFQVDDLAETEKRIEANGGKFFFDLGDERHGNFERKFKDPMPIQPLGCRVSAIARLLDECVAIEFLDRRRFLDETLC